MKRLSSLLIAVFCLAGTLSAFGAENEQPPVFSPGFKPVSLENLPDIPECRGMAIGQEIADRVRASAEDPAEAWEKKRREVRHMLQ
ncbi:MAG TPA: hypothetical protein VM733_03130, partial [Thermoanaerobaculia bacterium]|nr:hypothetical protein [Thermoanaerobaculia bacterium]